MLKLLQNTDPKGRVVLFFKEIIKTQKVYFLRGDGHPIVADSQFFMNTDESPATAIPFWSKSFLPFAKQWSSQNIIEEVSLEAFKEIWLPELDSEGMVLGINWDSEGAGYECATPEVIEYLEISDAGEEITLPDD